MKYEFKVEDFERFAREQGLGKLKYLREEIVSTYCPYCKRTTRDTDTFAINRTTGAFNCKRGSCDARGNMITLARDFGFSLGRDIDEYYSPRRSFRDLRQYPKPTIKPAAVSYMESRGISKEITEMYRVTVRKDNEGVLVFLFYDDGGELQFIKYRNINPKPGQSKEYCERETKPILFGMDHCDPARETLVLTEGQIDSLSVAEAFGGNVNAVSVPTGAKGFTWVPYCWDFLGKYETLVVFGDHENGHITLLDEMKQRFHGTVMHVRPEDYKDCKDANELLLEYGKDAVKAAVLSAVPVENKRIKKLSEVTRVDVSQMEAVSTGLRTLDKIVGGFFFGQLIILTGERGLGKSTLGSQFCVQTVQHGYKTFLYSGELTDFYVQDWFDRQAAGSSHINSKQTAYGYETFSVDGSCIENIHTWYNEKAYLYDNQIVADDEDEGETLIQTIETAINQYGCRVILLDNLMTAMEDDLKSDIYRQQTVFVRKLSNIAKSRNVLIILVVHPRKVIGNRSGRRNDDVAGSANVTNLADVVMWYEETTENDSDADRLLRVSKNRLNGRITKDGIKLWFEDSSKRISDREGYFNWRLGWETNDPVSSVDGFETVDDMEDIPF